MDDTRLADSAHVSIPDEYESAMDHSPSVDGMSEPVSVAAAATPAGDAVALDTPEPRAVLQVRRDDDSGPPDPAAAQIELDASGVTLEQIVEALLFSSDTALSAARLADLSGVGSVRTVRAAIETLNARYEQVGLTFRIDAIAGGYQMMSLPPFRPWLQKLNRQRAETRLSDAAMETLSIIAYRQPIIRADIEAIRGVSCSDGINRLREMGLVKVVGRAEIVGRPLLYGTTRKFLDVFGLADLNDLPPMEALRLRPVPAAKPATGEGTTEATPAAKRVAAGA